MPKIETPEDAAFQSRVPPDKMTAREAECFPEIVSAGTETQQVFLHIRNKLLYLWLNDPKKELTIERALSGIDAPYNSDGPLITRVHSFLDRYGSINFGLYQRLSTPKERRGKVIIIGAGISGLIAARQLESFGIDTIILESTDRVGGRIKTFKKNDYVADLGAMVITGLGGNPITVLSKQIDLELHKVRQRCPLYESNGNTIMKEKDEMIEKEFNRLLEASSYISHQMDFNTANGEPLSLGNTLEYVIKLQEKSVKEAQCLQLKQVVTEQEKLREIYTRMSVLIKKIKSSYQCYEEATDKSTDGKKNGNSDDVTIKFLKRKNLRELNLAVKEYESLMEKKDVLEKKLKELEENLPSDIYLSVSQFLSPHCLFLIFLF